MKSIDDEDTAVSDGNFETNWRENPHSSTPRRDEHFSTF